LGFEGNGWAVAVLDTGVDKNHNFLSGKVVSEACYSTNNFIATSLCPGGVSSSTATDSGLNCPLTTSGCKHGTHVAGIIAGKDFTPNGPGYNGVARGANIIAIQVFSQFTDLCTSFGLPSPCALSYPSDQMLGLERVYALRSTHNIAAANMSLGGGEYASNCDGDSLKPIIDNLRAADIATVIASGNSAFTNAMGTPACISTAISVGATCDSATAGRGCTAVDDIPNYSNIASFISLLAPGSLISSSTPGTNTFESWHGTSMAAPHVAGAWALMKQQDPGATVSTILAALQDTGTVVDDLRSGGSVTGMKRINVDPSFTVDLDSDSDGLTDGEEITLGTDPLNPDSDGDDLIDGDEVLNYGTNPLNIDTDGDGFEDGMEVIQYGSDPLDSTDTPANGDVTEDGQTNAGDLVVCTRIALGDIENPTEQQRVRCDMAPVDSVTGIPQPDGLINAADLMRLTQTVLQ
jgi:subtilisin family serine protease